MQSIWSNADRALGAINNDKRETRAYYAFVYHKTKVTSLFNYVKKTCGKTILKELLFYVETM